jgi:hypothetical protein
MIQRPKLSQVKETTDMPEICRFFGIIIRTYYNDHEPGHLHAVYQDNKAVVDFEGNVLHGGLGRVRLCDCCVSGLTFTSRSLRMTGGRQGLAKK